MSYLTIWQGFMLLPCFLKARVHLQYQREPRCQNLWATHRINTGTGAGHQQPIPRNPDPPQRHRVSSRSQRDLTGSRPRFTWTRVQQRLAGSDRAKSQLFICVAPDEAHIRPNCASTEDECLQTLQISRKLWKPGIDHKNCSELQRKPREEGSSVSQSSHNNNDGNNLSYKRSSR